MGKRTDESKREIDALTEKALPFLSAIRATPEDYKLRLTFADWLEEAGDPPRAELIRLQDEYAGRAEEDPDFIEDSPRLRELIDLHGQRWMGPFAAMEGVVCEFELGLLTVSTTNGALQRKALRGLVGHPHWAWDSEFDIGAVTDDTLPDVLASPLLNEVTHLISSSEGVLQRLADSTRLTRLDYLTAGSNSMTDRGMTILSGASWLGQLRWLDFQISNKGIGPDGIAAFVGALRSTHLWGLRFFFARVGDEGAMLLANSPHLAGLAKLGLLYCCLGDDGGMALAQSPHLKNLQMVEVAGNDFSRQTIRALLHRFGERLLWRASDVDI